MRTYTASHKRALNNNDTIVHHVYTVPLHVVHLYKWTLREHLDVVVSVVRELVASRFY